MLDLFSPIFSHLCKNKSRPSCFKNPVCCSSFLFQHHWFLFHHPNQKKQGAVASATHAEAPASLEERPAPSIKRATMRKGKEEAKPVPTSAMAHKVIPPTIKTFWLVGCWEVSCWGKASNDDFYLTPWRQRLKDQKKQAADDFVDVVGTSQHGIDMLVSKWLFVALGNQLKSG